MTTAESVKSKIQGLLDMANEMTGNNDTDLTTAVNALVAGFGQGGSGASGIYMAKITPASDKKSLTIQHDLGTTDILCALCWAETFGGVAPDYGITMRAWLKTDIPVRLTSSSTHSNIDIFNAYYASDAFIGVPGQPTSTAYLSAIKDENTMQIYSGGSSSAYFSAGVTYTVIIMAASAFSGV